LYSAVSSCIPILFIVVPSNCLPYIIGGTDQAAQKTQAGADPQEMPACITSSIDV
jgi:hypothetical protein